MVDFDPKQEKLESINNNLNNNADKKISMALMISFVILTIQYFLLIYFDLIGTSTSSIIQLISKGLVGLAFFYALPIVLKRSLNKFILIYLVAFFIFITNYIFFPVNRDYIITLVVPVFFMSLPALLFSLSIRDISIFKNIMRISANIILAIGILLGALIFSGQASIGAYSMTLSYYMLLPIIMLIDQIFEEFSLNKLFITSFMLLVIIALGSRGALLCIGVFIFLRSIKFTKTISYKKSFIYTLILSISILVYFNLENILININIFLLNNGIKSRSIQLFLMDEVHLSGRDYLYSRIIEEIIRNPIFGIGIAGDRNLLNGAYTHNFFIELISDFGIILGFLIAIVLIIAILKLFINKDVIKYNIIIIWFCLGFVHLMVSSSYIDDMNFWIFLGLVINLLFSKKKKLTGRIN